MSRDIGALNVVHIDGVFVRPITLVKLEFDTPVYVHNGLGNIEFDGDTYIGAGRVGAISQILESDNLAPSPIQLTLSGLQDQYVTEAFDAGNYGDRITVYGAYKNANGELVDTPWVKRAGFYEKSDLDGNNAVSITVQHKLAVLLEASGRRFTKEDQESEFPGDTGGSFYADMVNLQLTIGGRAAAGGSRDGRGRGSDGELSSPTNN